MVRALASRTLEMYGYAVIEAEDGEDALRQVSRRAEDDCDRRSPTSSCRGWTDGSWASGCVRPVLGLRFCLHVGSHGDELARRRLLDSSVPFLQKPFHPDELVSPVQELLELAAGARYEPGSGAGRRARRCCVLAAGTTDRCRIATESGTGELHISGTVHFLLAEGGCWQLKRTGNGRHYELRPEQAPASLLRDGARVSVVGQPAEGSATGCEVGMPIDVRRVLSFEIG